MNLTEETVNFILRNKVDMLMLLPKASHSHAYTQLFHSNYDWYRVVMGLSENLSNSKKRSVKFGWRCNLDLSYLVQLWFEQEGRCALSGVILDYESGSLDSKNPFRTSVDRIHNGQGYVKGNVRLLSHWANNAKSTWDDSLFQSFIESTHKKYAQRIS